jgi:cell filamentation protein, protein adenylyltransferase
MSRHDRFAFSPAYRRFTPEITNSLLAISEALGIVRGARVLPAIADQLRASARIGTVHYSNLIEGNQLPLVAAERAARRELSPDSRARIELVNYVEALDLIDERIDAGTLELRPSFLKQLHGVTTRGLGRKDDAHFKPHHEGEWRDGIAVVMDRFTDQIMHEGPPPDEVAPRMESMLDWVERKLAAGEPPYVVAGVVHYGITDVHPFADGNGRVARLFQAAVLLKAGVLPGRMFSFERYYAEDRDAYYEALRSVRRRTFNMEFWLDYFLRGLAEEYERVAATVTDLDSLFPGGGVAPLQLSPAQQNALTNLRIQGRREFTRRDYEAAGQIGRSASGEGLKALVNHGVLQVRGAGADTRYAFTSAVNARSQGAGRPTKWTDSMIERELRTFLTDRSSWPSQDEFAEAGRRDLYAAASRRGGIRRWRTIIGL